MAPSQSSGLGIEALERINIACQRHLANFIAQINMDSLLPQLLAFPPHPPPATPLTDAEYEKQMRSQLHLLKQVPASTLINFVSEGTGLLDVCSNEF